MDQEQKISPKKYLIFGVFGGLVLGIIFPIAGTFLFDCGGKVFKIVGMIFSSPIILISSLAQPVFQLEAEKTFYIYAPVSITVWPLLGFLAGYLFFKWKRYQWQRNNPDIFPGSKAQSNWRIAIALIILAGFFAYAGILYSQTVASYRYRDEINKKRNEQETIKQQKRLEKKLAEEEAEKQKTEKSANSVNDQMEEDATVSKFWKTSEKWKRYVNKKYGLALDLPSNWSASEYETYKDYVDVKIVNVDLPADVRNDFAMWLIATKKNYIPDGPANGVGYCAVEFDTLDGFCATGCKKLNSRTAVDYRIVNHGEPLASAQAYSTVSDAYPAICLEMGGFYQEVDRIARNEGIGSEELMKKYDLKSVKSSSNIPEELLEIRDFFEKVAGSISKS